MERKSGSAGPEVGSGGAGPEEITEDAIQFRATKRSESALIWKKGRRSKEADGSEGVEGGRLGERPDGSLLFPIRVNIHESTGGGRALVFARLAAEPGYKYSEHQLSCGLPRVSVIEEGLAGTPEGVSRNAINAIRSELAQSGFGFYFSRDEIDLAFGPDIGFEDPRALERTTRPVIVDVGGSADAPDGDDEGGTAAEGD